MTLSDGGDERLDGLSHPDKFLCHVPEPENAGGSDENIPRPLSGRPPTNVRRTDCRLLRTRLQNAVQ